MTNDHYPASSNGFGYGFSNDTGTFQQYIVTGSQMQWLHDPTISDTSALTYTCQYRTIGDQGFFNYGGTAVITVTEIGA